jgi:serine/threonine protein kinase/WD40 repeat protein
MIETGQMLAHYKLVEKIGEGGMGVVWKALDTTLNRDAAIKILPDAFAEDADRRGRFEREARLLATLNHPNIAGVYGLHVDKGLSFIAMEFVPGEDLAVRLARGPMAVDDALDVARQVAEALEAAHGQGVIHRDLKPANITRTPEGKIKVLDLGLAKALATEVGSDSTSLSLSPTATSAGTVAGTLLGTASYMSPEQVKGKEADQRADIWAFGCVLFEMLTGKQTFGGETISEVMASVLRDRPKDDSLPAETPAAARHLLKRCLDPDRNTRLRDMGEARIALSPEGLANATDLGSGGATSAPASNRKRERIAWAVAALALIGLAASFLLLPQSAAPEIRASIIPPVGQRFGSGGNSAGGLSISPDGTMMTFVASIGSGRTSLYLRTLGAEVPRKLPGTEGASYPFWSPDSKQIAFFADAKLMKLDLSGGAPLTVTSAPDGRGGTWGPNGTILFSPETQESIHRVSVGGLLAEPVTTLENERMGETTHRYPSFLPDGRHFLYLRGSHSAASQDDVNAIWIGDIESDETSQLMRSGTQASYAQGHIFWVRDQFLMARPFSADKLAFTGDAFAVGEGVVVLAGSWRAAFAAAEGGPLAFHGGSAAEQVLTMFDREGNVLDTIGEEAIYGFVRLSPDNKSLAASVADRATGRSDLWVYDLERKVGSRLTFHEAQDTTPVWSPDGKRVAFASNRNGISEIFVRQSDGRGEVELLFSGKGRAEPDDWSSDGKNIVFSHGAGKYDLWVLPLEDGEAYEFISTEFDEGYSRLSPDGEWLAYLSNEAGRYELFLTRFPSGEGKWQLSKNGSDWLVGWNGSGEELYFLDVDGDVAAVKVRLGDQVVVDLPEKLFSRQANQTWASMSDGERFIFGVAGDTGEESPITLILNWEPGSN